MPRGSGRGAPRGGGRNFSNSRGGRGGSKSNSRDDNRAQAAQRMQRKEQSSSSAPGGPSNVLGVYDYVVNSEGTQAGGSAGGKKRKRNDRALRRATAGFEESAAESSAALNKKRRRNDGDEEGDDGEDDDEDDDLSDTERIRAPAIFSDGEDGDGEAKPFEGEDEDIDSDEAFGESDEERYDGWAFSGSKAKRDEDEDDEDDEDGMGLDQVLNAVSDDDDDDDDDEGDDEEAGVRGLDDVLGSASSGQGIVATSSKPANFFNFDEAQAADSASGPLTLEDLLAPLAQDASLGGAELRKRVSALASDSKGKGKAKEGAGALDARTGALAAPLPAILQDRVDRAAAYEVTRNQVEGWQPTLKRLREAEHLSFPLQKQPEVKSSNASLVSSMLSTKQGSVLRSALESQTADLLRAAEMTDSQIAKHEELALNKLDPSLVEERRRELARMRELMFRAEQKAKRVSKIKSKSYRRIARKEKEKLKQKMADAGLSMEDDGDEVDYEADQAERVKAERERALERATLKHKNTGQWAKAMSGRRERPAETTAALEDQLRRGEQLRKKVQGEDEGDESGDDDEDDDDEDDDEDAAGFRSDLEENEEEIAEAAASGEVSKGFGKLMQMKFMKDARAKADQGVREAAEELRVQLAGLESGDDDDDDDDDGEAAALRGRVAAVGGSAGRAVFSAAAGADKVTAPKANKKAIPAQQQKQVASSSSSSTAAAQKKDTENPWLNAGVSASTSAKRKDRNPSKSKQRAMELAEDARVDLLDEDLLDSGDVSKTTTAPATAATSRGKAKATDDSGPSSSRGIAFTQRDLVAEAFAGDDVTAQFAEEKRALMEADAPQEEDNSLPGWGSWSGKGIKHNAAQKARIAANRAKHTRTLPGLAPSQRKDAGMEHVVINERVDKKVEKYKVKDLPYPFTSAAQYELVMRGAMGAEWNTRTQHQRMTLPRVVTKPGKAIAPIERKF